MEYELVGGPSDGRRLTVQDGVAVIRVPVMRPFEPFRKVVAFRRDVRELSYDIAEYHRAGSVYRWEGLIGDAWCDMAVSQEVVKDGGPLIRREVRRQMRRKLERLADTKEVDRIVWRVTRDAYGHMFRVRALVGPRRVERGLQDRAERKTPTAMAAAADRMDEAMG